MQDHHVFKLKSVLPIFLLPRITKDKFYIENKLRAYSHTENGQQTLSVLLYSNLLSDVRAHITFKCYPSAV